MTKQRKGVEIFDKATFEKALPMKKDNSGPAWVCGGLEMGEYVYYIPLGTPDKPLPAQVIVRSSVDKTGWSRATGEDSIRIYVVDREGRPLSGKANRWTTRLPGWQERMTEIIRFMAEMAVKIDTCPKCHKELTRLNKVKKEGPNKGRWFISCRACNDHFEWMGKDNDDDTPQCGSPGLPPCPGCDGNTMKELTVKKEGPNKGRKFFKCGDEKCGYFQWADEE